MHHTDYGCIQMPDTTCPLAREQKKPGVEIDAGLPSMHGLSMLVKVSLWLLNVVFLILLGGCSASIPEDDPTNFKDRAVTRASGGVQVSSVVLSPEESLFSLGYPLAKKDIQPIWVEIKNDELTDFFLMLINVDANYFSPSEVAWKFRRYDSPDVPKANTLAQRADYFHEKHIPVRIPARSSVSGFVYTNLDPGRKAYTIEVMGRNEVRSLDFFQAVPGFEADYQRVDFRSLHASADRRDLTLNELRRYLEKLPCCTSGGDRRTDGDPLNLVFVGEGRKVMAALARRGWDLTETTRASSVGRMVASSVFKSQYRTSPISPLFLFGREQDIALQKVRRNVDERNHMRMWRAPVNMNGEPVWVGQVSRDIGIKLSGVTVVTHKIDPLVDEARLYVTLDMIASRSLRAIGHVSGVGPAGRGSGRVNYTRDPYYTDGNRVVLFVSGDRVLTKDIRYLDWEEPQPSRPRN